MKSFVWNSIHATKISILTRIFTIWGRIKHDVKIVSIRPKFAIKTAAIYAYNKC